MGDKTAFDGEFFGANRRRLRESFEGQAPIVLTAHSSLQLAGSEPLPFRQDSSFWYFTGIDTAGAVLVMESQKEYLILPELDPVMVMFYGDHDIDNIRKSSGVDTIYVGSEGWHHLERRIKRVKHVATIQPSPPYIERLDMFTNPSRARLVSRLLEINSDLDLIDLSSHIQRLRMVKQESEISAIRSAVDDTVELYKRIDKKLAKIGSEIDIDILIRNRALELGTQLAFDPIVASGKNASTIHYTSNDAVFSPGDPLLIDVGYVYAGYSADLTRTISREPSARFLQVYEAVASTHYFALSLLKPGVNLETYEQAVRQYMGEKMRELGLISIINDEETMRYNPTRTSHFLGLDTHDVGDFGRPLTAGVVLTVEPGIYIKEEGIGVRIEDDVLITDGGYEVLSGQLPVSPTSLTM